MYVYVFVRQGKDLKCLFEISFIKYYRERQKMC